MRTTINVDDSLLAEARAEAGRSHRRLGAVVDDALRLLLRSGSGAGEAATPIPVWGDPDGRPLVELADRDAVAAALGDDRLS